MRRTWVNLTFEFTFNLREGRGSTETPAMPPSSSYILLHTELTFPVLIYSLLTACLKLYPLTGRLRVVNRSHLRCNIGNIEGFVVWLTFLHVKRETVQSGPQDMRGICVILIFVYISTTRYRGFKSGEPVCVCLYCQGWFPLSLSLSLRIGVSSSLQHRTLPKTGTGNTVCTRRMCEKLFLLLFSTALHFISHSFSLLQRLHLRSVHDNLAHNPSQCVRKDLILIDWITLYRSCRQFSIVFIIITSI